MQLIKFVMGTDHFIPIQAVLCAMKGHQELCKALGVMERAALEGSHSSNSHKHAENPVPLGLAVLALLRRAQTPILVPCGGAGGGDSVAGLLCGQGSSAGEAVPGLTGGAGWERRRRLRAGGCRAWPLQRERAGFHCRHGSRRAPSACCLLSL